MPTPNLFIVYVSDAAASADFYRRLFDMRPTIASPRFAEFRIAEGVSLALWSGSTTSVDVLASRTSEVCVNLTGGPDRIRAEYDRWRGLGVDIVEEPHEDVFGLTFLARDPDGNLLRIAPVDPDPAQIT